MDEIKDTQKNSPQSPGKASEGSEETTPKADAKTHTETDVAKAVQNALIKAGRDAKSLTNRETTVQAREDANKAGQERRDAAELAEAQKDPDKLAEYQSKKAERERAKTLDEREAAQTKREAEHEAEITASKEAQKEITVWQVASAKNIDPVRLKTLADKFNVEGKEQLEALADEIASGTGETKDPLKIDSGVTKGGSGEKSEEQKLEERYPSMK